MKKELLVRTSRGTSSADAGNLHKIYQLKLTGRKIADIEYVGKYWGRSGITQKLLSIPKIKSWKQWQDVKYTFANGKNVVINNGVLSII